VSDDGIKDLIREIAAEHGVALDRDDPILILHTATRIIVRDALRQAQQATEEALAQHRSELELAAAKWQLDSKRTAAEFLQHVPTVIASNIGAELGKAASNAVSQLEQGVTRHEKALARSTLACAMAAAVALLAAAAFLWASAPAPERPHRRDHTASSPEEALAVSLGSTVLRRNDNAPASGAGPRCG